MENGNENKELSPYVTDKGFERIKKAIDRDWRPTVLSSQLNKAKIMKLLDEEIEKADLSLDFSDRPNTAPGDKFGVEKWDDSYARNALLWYIEKKGLSDDCEKWLNAQRPERIYDE